MIAWLLVLVASPTKLAEPPLQPLAALIGHCWAGPAPGSAGMDKHCFESIYGGQHVRDRHSVTVNDKEVYAGESVYSARGPQVIFTYWNSLGGLGTGTAVISGDAWRFNGTIHATASSNEVPITATWKFVPGGYEVTEGSDQPRLLKRVD
jgi:hypothetical protein